MVTKAAKSGLKPGDITPAEVAAWMMQALDGAYVLHQSVAVSEIMQRFGDEFAWINENGSMAIKSSVLKAFDAMTGDDVVWERSGRLWRQRQYYDLPGRQQP